MRSLIFVVALWPALAHATEIGLDVGHVVDRGTPHDHIDAVDSTGVGWVRINFRLDTWTAPDDDTPHGPDQLTWFQTYDQIVDAYLARGIQVYALINDESVDSHLDHNGDAWIALYVQNAVEIVDHFKNRVRVFEIINEPNDYAGGSSARFTAAAFAKILQDTYVAVKYDAGHAGDRCWQVQLVSGPLYSFDNNSSAGYLQQAYTIGRGQLGWDDTRQATGSYPLDGVGYHMYVAQGANASTADVANAMSQNLGAVWNVLTANEGAGTVKRLWVSEFGWQAGVVGSDAQAQRIQAGFAAIDQFGKAALATYFNLQDFSGASFGVFDAAGNRRTGADTLKSLGDANHPPHAALVTSVVLPSLAPGATGEAIVTLENRGATPWTDGFRLGAAPGCPDAADTNAIDWVPDSATGYANNQLDARVYLKSAVASGDSVEIHVPIRAPMTEGEYTFAARMVDEGVAWFGATASAPLVVAADIPGSGEHQGGCSTSEGPRFGEIALVGLALGRRRCRRLRHREPKAR